MSEDTNEPKTADLRSVHTSNFPQILNQLGMSLLVSTYQAGKLIVVRSAGDVINTHFRDFKKPMGVAADGVRVAIGTSSEVHEYYNVPAVSSKLDPPNRHDGCYVPRNVHTTGDIDIHEMAWDAQGELWGVNTRFSCLANFSLEHSFVPRWRPKFISALTPEDRCHLNGLAMQGGRPRFVTALGSSDVSQGWRERKADGGVLMDVESNEILIDGLSMPHSPRWYDERLWVLESGQGNLSTVDLAAGRLQPVAELPGFTRGIDFAGPLAFIGLSKVRESAVFSGIPLTQRLEERTCGVWVVNITNGQTIAFLRFEEAVQEIFAVQLVPLRYPEILEPDDKLLISTYSLPDEALRDVPQELLNVDRDSSTDEGNASS